MRNSHFESYCVHYSYFVYEISYGFVCEKMYAKINDKITMKCPKCNTDNVDGAKFCASCGGQLPVKQEQTKVFCQKCGAENLSNSKFCCS